VGFMVFLESDSGQVRPDDYGSDTKMLADMFILEEVLDAVETAAEIDMSVLRKSAPADEGDLDEYLEFCDDEETAAAELRKTQELREAAWQAPAELTRGLDAIIARLEDDNARAEFGRTLEASGKLAAFGLPLEYYTGGGFTEDLEDLRDAATWEHEHGAQRVRLTIG